MASSASNICRAETSRARSGSSSAKDGQRARCSASSPPPLSLTTTRAPGNARAAASAAWSPASSMKSRIRAKPFSKWYLTNDSRGRAQLFGAREKLTVETMRAAPGEGSRLGGTATEASADSRTTQLSGPSWPLKRKRPAKGSASWPSKYWISQYESSAHMSFNGMSSWANQLGRISSVSTGSPSQRSRSKTCTSSPFGFVS
mmetsp:Transcript_109966/g.344038  ORF Transcript_109966/g.344038 Transcript_109966/m.344038 type:complete len:202 (-) Transcript_109966:220-825(-)